MEERYCLDCHYIGPLDSHGRCPKCGSNAVVPRETHRAWDARLVAEMRHQISLTMDCD